MFTANSMQHTAFSEMLSLEFSLKAYRRIVLMAINVILCMAFCCYHLGSSFLSVVYTSTELWLFKPYKIKKKKVEGFYLSGIKVRRIYFCNKNKWRIQTM